MYMKMVLYAFNLAVFLTLAKKHIMRFLLFLTFGFVVNTMTAQINLNNLKDAAKQ